MLRFALPARLLLCLALLLTACASSRASLPQTVMQTVGGSFDRSADRRERLRGKLRRLTVWTHQPPVPAQEVRVIYDAEQRAESWRLELSGAARSLQELTGATQMQPLGTLGGSRVTGLQGGSFAGSLALQQKGGLALVSRAYALHFEPQLLPFIGRLTAAPTGQP